MKVTLQSEFFFKIIYREGRRFKEFLETLWPNNEIHTRERLTVVKITAKLWCAFSFGIPKRIHLLSLVRVEGNLNRIHGKGKVTSNTTQIS
jgi:hypothetical protein